jgi:hypothetical protein
MQLIWGLKMQYNTFYRSNLALWNKRYHPKITTNIFGSMLKTMAVTVDILRDALNFYTHKQ